MITPSSATPRAALWRASQATLPSHAIFSKRRAVPPVSWPLQRHDWQALIITICVTAIFWQ
jgi:hypothetical protein